jgi:prefoldin subunit 5
MPIPLLPPISTVFAPILASPVFSGQPSYQKKLELILLQAAEAKAILAPILKRGVSWNSISTAAFAELRALETQGVIPSDIAATIQTSLSTAKTIETSTTQLTQAYENIASGKAGDLTQTLTQINSIASDLTQSTASLNTTLTTLNQQQTTVAGATGISNSKANVIEVFKDSQARAAVNLTNLTSSITFVSSDLLSAKTQNLITGNTAQTAAAQQVLSQVTKNIKQVTDIANKMTQTINNVQSIADNLKSFKTFKLGNGKRKPRKVLYPIPSFLNPNNNAYVKMYKELNGIITSVNTAMQAIGALGDAAASLDIF